MKKLFLLLMFFIVTLVTVYSQQNWVTIMSENFENNFPSTNWLSFYNSSTTNTNAYWAKVSTDAHTGNYSAWCAAGGTNGVSPTLGYYPDNMNAQMIYGPFDLSDALAARLSFYMKYSTEPSNDNIGYGVSIDSGPFYMISLNGTSNSWNKYTLNLDDNTPIIGNLCGRKNIRIAFNFLSNGSYNHYNGAYIDDILLEKYSPINLGNIDFETIGQNWSWKFTNNTNSTFSVVNNPSNTGINTSSKCLKFNDYFGYCTGGTCIGDELFSYNMGDLTFTKDNCKIKIMVFKSGISDVRIRFYNVELQNYYEEIVSNTSINQWEELTFDFTDYIGYKVDKISIFPDSRYNITEDGYCYIDNISFNSITTTPKTQPLPLNENFGYTAGTGLIGQSGWVILGTSTANALVTSAPGTPAITYPGYPGSGIGNEVAVANNGQDIADQFTPQTSGTVYYSVLVNISAALTGDYFMNLGEPNSSTFYFGRLFVKLDGAKIAFGILNGSGGTTTVTYTTSIYDLNVTYLAVVKVDVVTGTSSLIINPAIGSSEPAASNWITSSSPANGGVGGTTIPTVAGLGEVNIRQGSSSAAPTLRLDGIHIATSYAALFATSGLFTPSANDLEVKVVGNKLSVSNATSDTF
jgi:hypothetical protein